MGYIFVLIALLAGATKGYCGKKTSGLTTGYRDAVAYSFLRMIFCVAIGVCMIVLEGSTKYIVPDMTVILTGALSGFATSMFVVSWLVSVKKGAYMMVDVVLMLGTLVPLLFGQVLFDELITLKQWIGFIVLVIAVLIMCSYNSAIKGSFSLTSVVLLVVCGISSGLADFSQKLFVKQATGVPVSVFNFYTYLFSAVMLLVFYIIFSFGEKDASGTEVRFGRVALAYIGVMAVCLFVNSYFKTLAALYLDSAKLYPLNQGAALVISMLMASLFFEEKLTSKSVLGVSLAFVGLLIINVL